MNEEQLEQTALDLLKELGWETVDAFDESFGVEGTLGRDSLLNRFWFIACCFVACVESGSS